MLSNFIALNLLELKICTKESMSFKYGMSSIVFYAPIMNADFLKRDLEKGELLKMRSSAKMSKTC